MTLQSPTHQGVHRFPCARDCPFVGLVPFSEEDEAFFFGREREAQILSDNVLAARLTILYGASGVGKSRCCGRH